MIVIKHTENHISIKGHANYDVIGKDIVCSAVSILIQTLIQSIEELTADTIKYSMSAGNVDIEYRNLTEKSKTLLDSFFVGLKMIADEYPNNVRLSKR